MAKENIIISLGGSLVCPAGLPDKSGGIDVVFLKSFKKLVLKYLDSKKFFMFVGGGAVCRDYQKALLEFGADNKERDWMGISISRLNAQIVKQVFTEVAFDKVVTDPVKKVNSRKDVAIFAGWKPGWSTDYCSVMLAKNMGIKTIVNLTNIDYVYDKDPRKLKDAKPFKEIDWKSFRQIVGDKWTPGLSAPFDPRASKMAEILKIKVVIINGAYLERLDNFLNNKTFIGTVIK